MSHTSSPAAVDPDLTLLLAEERVVISKRDVTTARVQVSTHVASSEQVARASLETDEVTVTRVAVDRIVDGERPLVREVDGVTIIPIFEEVLFVEKKLLLKEELHIRKSTTAENVEIPVTLRTMTAKVERVPMERQRRDGIDGPVEGQGS